MGYLYPASPSISYETGFTAQKTSVPDPSALLGLSIVGLLGLYKKRFFA
ncbi:PEP-CTERM sorting domain-containing protein [Nostoc sp.]